MVKIAGQAMKRILAIIVFVPFALAAFGQQALPYSIEKIEYKSQAGDWEGCSYRLIINADKTVEYIADSMYCKPLIRKQQTIDKESYNKIIGMLNKIEFQKLKDSYGSNGVDVGIDVLTITYDNGKIKKIIVIEDAPKRLKNILHLLYRLKDAEHWK
jgi:hypothetical protein